VHEEVSQILSAFLDDELTQAEYQRVRLHLEDCADCRQTLDELRALHDAVQTIEFPEPSTEELDQLGRALSVRAPRVAGWMLILTATAIWIGYAVYRFLTQPEIELAELLFAAIIVGFVLLFVSVLRQRLLELPNDRYRRVRR